MEDDKELAEFWKEVMDDCDRDILIKFIEWYAIHYGYLINKDNVDIYLKEKNNVQQTQMDNI